MSTLTAPGSDSEQFHHHQILSIFVHFGFPISGCVQRGYNPEGKAENSKAPSCKTKITAATPKSLQILFVGSQWLHANHLLAPMGLPNARDCPHSLAPRNAASV